MLQRFFEWYRMVTPTPSDDTIQKRQAAVAEVVEHLRKDKKVDLLLEITQAAVNGLGNDDSAAARLMVAAIRKSQPAFPQDVTENGFELRACFIITLGELLNRYKQDKHQHAVLVASLLVAANTHRPPATERYLKKAVEELNALAVTAIEQASAERRQRESETVQNLREIAPPADVDGFWKLLLPQLEACFSEVRDQAQADREELQVLWWLYRGYSDNVMEKFLILKPGAASLLAGAELGELVLWPPAMNAWQILQRAAEDGRKRNECTPQTLKQVVSQWKSEMLSVLAPEDQKLGDFLQKYPTLLPLSWLCRAFEKAVWQQDGNLSLMPRQASRVSTRLLPGNGQYKRSMKKSRSVAFWNPLETKRAARIL